MINILCHRAFTILQLFHHYPKLEPFYFNFEKNYDPVPIYHTVASDRFYIIPFTATVLYFMLCYFGPIFMKNQDTWNIDGILAAWNLFFASFSLYGTIRVLPHFLYRMTHLPFEATICESVYSSFAGGAVGLAAILFIFSKYFELFDTFFIIVKKKPIIFLHYYHHITVLLFTWHSFLVKSAMSIYFICMNYFVHTIMYFYYFLHGIRCLPKSFPVFFITFLQILQMIGGCIIIGFATYYKLFGGKIYTANECQNDVINIIFGLIIYLSYLLCFIHFAWKKFSPKKIVKKRPLPKDEIDTKIRNGKKRKEE